MVGLLKIGKVVVVEYGPRTRQNASYRCRKTIGKNEEGSGDDRTGGWR